MECVTKRGVMDARACVSVRDMSASLQRFSFHHECPNSHGPSSSSSDVQGEIPTVNPTVKQGLQVSIWYVQVQWTLLSILTSPCDAKRMSAALGPAHRSEIWRMSPLRVQGLFKAHYLKAHLYLPAADQHRRVNIPYNANTRTLQYSRRTLASSSQVPSIRPKNTARRRGQQSRSTTIRTLCPTKLTREDHLSIRRKGHSTLNFFILFPQDVRYVDVVLPMLESLRLPSNSDRGGFLYYHQPPRAPPFAGEIRFRLTPSPEPTSFSAGVDLTNKSGTPWRISLPSIPRCESWDPFCVLLTEVDKTVSKEVMTLARRSGHLKATRAGDSRVTRCLYAFGQPFEFSLENKCHTFTLVGKAALLRAKLDFISRVRTQQGHNRYVPQNPFSGNYSCSRSVAVVAMLALTWSLYTGTIICCFEPSPLPEHNAKRIVVIRVLRTLDSDPVRPNPSYTGPQYPPELMPRAGELLLKLGKKGKLRPWAYNVDKHSPTWNAGDVQHNGGPLRVLFENAISYGSDLRH